MESTGTCDLDWAARTRLKRVSMRPELVPDGARIGPLRERRQKRLLSSVAVSTVTGGAGARYDTVTDISSLRDLEEASWGVRGLRGGVLRSLSPDAPIIAFEEELERLNRTLEVGSSITSLLEVTGESLSLSLGG